MTSPFNLQSHELPNAIWLHVCAYRLRLERSLQNEEYYPGADSDRSDGRIALLKNRIKTLETATALLLDVISKSDV